MVRTEREPLLDLNDVLLGHSCRAFLSHAEALTWRFSYERMAAWRDEAGINDQSRGLKARYEPANLRHVIEWFQPL